MFKDSGKAPSEFEQTLADLQNPAALELLVARLAIDRPVSSITGKKPPTQLAIVTVGEGASDACPRSATFLTPGVRVVLREGPAASDPIEFGL